MKALQVGICTYISGDSLSRKAQRSLGTKLLLKGHPEITRGPLSNYSSTLKQKEQILYLALFSTGENPIVENVNYLGSTCGYLRILYHTSCNIMFVTEFSRYNSSDTITLHTHYSMS